MGDKRLQKSLIVIYKEPNFGSTYAYIDMQLPIFKQAIMRKKKKRNIRKPSGNAE